MAARGRAWLLLGLLTVGAARGAVTVADRPVGPGGLRPKQECSDLGLWLGWLVGEQAVPLATACGELPEPLCLALVHGGPSSCDGVRNETLVRAALDAVRARHQPALWAGVVTLTVSAWNNWALVRVLLTSVLSTNPALERAVWLVADRWETSDPEVSTIRAEFDDLAALYRPRRVEMMSVADAGLAMAYDPLELAMRYELKEFSAALKPAGFARLLQTNASAVLYFDPDILVFAGLDEVALRLRARSVVLTPHVLVPTPSDGLWPSDLQLLRAGVFNVGFVGLSRAQPGVAADLVAWWAARLRYQGEVDLSRGLHSEQGWSSLIPALFPSAAVHVLQDPRYNVAYWNLHYTGRHVEVRGNGSDARAVEVLYAGAPLVFFHFSGMATERFDPEHISPHQTRFSAAELTNLRPLLRLYVALTGTERHARCRRVAYGFNHFDNGVRVPPWVRALLFQTHAEGRTQPSAPYLPEPEHATSLREIGAARLFDDRAEGSLWAWLGETSASSVVLAGVAEAHVPNFVERLLGALGVRAAECGAPPAVTSWGLSFGVVLGAYGDGAALGNGRVRELVAQQCAALARWRAAEPGDPFAHERAPSAAQSARPEGHPLLEHAPAFCAALFDGRARGRGGRGRSGRRGPLLPEPTPALRWWARGGADDGARAAELESPPPDWSPPAGSLLAELERRCPRIAEHAPNASAQLPHRVWWRALSARAPPPAAEAARRRGARPFGVNVIGHFGGMFGVGKMAEYLYAGLREAGVPTAAVAWPRSAVHAYAPFRAAGRAAPFRFNLVALNAQDEAKSLGQARAHGLPAYPWSAWASQYNIGYWAWETERAPPAAHLAALGFDEIWAISNYTAGAVRARLRADALARHVPVFAADVGVPDLRPLEEVAALRAESRRALELPPELCVFLHALDCRSVPRRKNAEGAVRAFQRAFERSDGSVRLLLKQHNCDARFEAELTAQIDGWPSIHVLSGHYPPERLRALKLGADCYVSLHRSEGYGLNLLEAVLDGTPVIASAYSGSLDFMGRLPAALRDGLGVRCPRARVGAGAAPYSPDDMWCEPSLDDAVRAMRTMRDQRARVVALALQAAPQMRALFSAAAIGRVHAGALRRVQERWARGGLRAAYRAAAPPPEFSLDCLWLHVRARRIAKAAAAAAERGDSDQLREHVGAAKPEARALNQTYAAAAQPRQQRGRAAARADARARAGGGITASCAFYSASTIALAARAPVQQTAEPPTTGAASGSAAQHGAPRDSRAPRAADVPFRRPRHHHHHHSSKNAPTLARQTAPQQHEQREP